MSDPGVPTADEMTAAIAAIDLLLRSEERDFVPGTGDERSGWQASARLAVQHLRPARIRARPSWHTIERLRNATSGGFGGVTGT